MAQNSVIVKNYSNVFEEIPAAGAITPGMLIELTSAGAVVAHNTASDNALPMFAKEDEYQGKGVNDAYASGDKVAVWIPGRGDQVYAILADGQSVAIGDFLESNGEGFLQKHEAGSAAVVEAANPIVGVATEAVDLSASSGKESSGPLGLEKRIIVRIS